MTSQAAPGQLEVVRAFVNTLDIETSADTLSEPPALVPWLEANGLSVEVARVGRDELRRAVDLREALRALLLANNGVPHRFRVGETLDLVASRAGLAVRFAPDAQVRLAPRAGGIDGALGGILALVAGAMADGTWPRLKACRAERCGWAYYDRAPNRSRTWCSMAVCGNRSKARTFRERRWERL